MNQNQVFLFKVLLTVLGSLLLVLNFRHLVEVPGIIPVSAILFVAPVVDDLRRDRGQTSRGRMMVIVLIPLVVTSWVYYLSMGFPVGFQDVNNHIEQYEKLFGGGGISFTETERASYNFVGLYLLYHAIESVSDSDIIHLAATLPPFTNLVLIATLFLWLSRLFEQSVAVPAALVYGWTNNVLVFGQEFRTQTLGILALMVLLVVVSLFKRGEVAPALGRTLTQVGLFCAVVLSSLVSWFVAAVMMATNVATYKILHREHGIGVSGVMVLILMVLCPAYIMFIGRSLDTIAVGLSNLLWMTLTMEPFSLVLRSGQLIYGVFVRWFMYLFWGLAILGGFLYVREMMKRDLDIRMACFLSIFGVVSVLVVLNAWRGPLSAGRFYVVAMPLVGVMIGFLSKGILSGSQGSTMEKVGTGLIGLLLIGFVTANLAKLPGYIIGETMPIRGLAGIDEINYWHLYPADSRVFAFAATNYVDGKVAVHTLLKRYWLLSIVDPDLRIGEATEWTRRAIAEWRENNVSIAVLEDKWLGHGFSGKDLLPDRTEYDFCNMVYTNGDYLVFYGITVN
jgi:hypothetical protein